MRPEKLLEDWAGTSFEYEILQANPWTANFVVAQHYFKGRTVLAGDAAHQFVPTGGYGMNSGIADAAGLSWVLAALLQGWGGDDLLSAYEAERKPTAWFHLAASKRHMGVRMQIGEVYMTSGDLNEAGAAGDARRAAAGAKIANLGNAENESWGVEWGYRYDASPVIVHEPNPPDVDPTTYLPNTWPGSRLPHVFLEPGVSLHDRLGLFFTLIVLGESDVTAIQKAAARQNMPLDVLRLDREDLMPILQRRYLLVRPDQHIAWRGNSFPENPEALIQKVLGTKKAS
jgi:hypothetical protein